MVHSCVVLSLYLLGRVFCGSSDRELEPEELEVLTLFKETIFSGSGIIKQYHKTYLILRYVFSLICLYKFHNFVFGFDLKVVLMVSFWSFFKKSLFVFEPL